MAFSRKQHHQINEIKQSINWICNHQRQQWRQCIFNCAEALSHHSSQCKFAFAQTVRTNNSRKGRITLTRIIRTNAYSNSRERLDSASKHNYVIFDVG